ncbi:MAG TPA: hypothetical protein EYH09_01735 [Candidatus Nanopusillus sp.]|nr:hypothetical protein [Candidatus Nanopusillus sp.]HIP90021.1 hypothetical protein [Candidatus Nanopusillus sp.]
MVSDILKFYGLRENPFSLGVDLSSFVNYQTERAKIINAIENKEKIILILGPTGSGKTTLLLWLYSQIKYKNSVYIARPPKSISKLYSIIHNSLPIVDRIKFLFGYDIFKLLNRNMYVIIIDEATFMSDDIVEWIKILADQTKAIFILAGLPEFEEKLIKRHRTLYERVLTKVYLRSLNKDAAIELIKKRLQKAGNTEVFTEDALEEIYKLSGGFPRNILKISYEAILLGYELKIRPINKEVIDRLKQPSQKRLGLNLPEKQKIVIEYLTKNGARSSKEIYNYLKEIYNNITIHSVSVLLKRMVNSGYLIRSKKGNIYIYDVSPSVKNLFIKELQE